MFVSFTVASGRRANFESTISAETLSSLKKQEQMHPMPLSLTDRHRLKTNAPSPEESGRTPPAPDQWGLSERVWATLRYHIPLVDSVVTDEWQAANRPLCVTDRETNGQCARPQWWEDLFRMLPAYCFKYIDRWPKARDWFGAMQWFNWILWPLFLPYLMRKLRRPSDSRESP
jgi:hypothetical protein